jgi:hypothetical protein
MPDLTDRLTNIIETEIRESGHRLGHPVGASRLAERIVDALCDAELVAEDMNTYVIARAAAEIRRESPAGTWGCARLAEQILPTVTQYVVRTDA